MLRTCCALALFALGCSSARHTPDAVERARVAVTAALDNWKANEPPAKLKALADPVDFTEELRATHALESYQIVKADATDATVIRYTVALKLKDKKGKSSDREAVFSVALKAPIVVARDPYF
jgi:hypothetical protein